MMRAYERLLRYVKVNTTSDPESATHPTTARQFDLANILVEELKGLGNSVPFQSVSEPPQPSQENAEQTLAFLNAFDDME